MKPSNPIINISGWALVINDEDEYSCWVQFKSAEFIADNKGNLTHYLLHGTNRMITEDGMPFFSLWDVRCITYTDELPTFCLPEDAGRHVGVYYFERFDEICQK